MTIRLTKNELRLQQLKLQQLTTYLPTLQLKKAMLQTQIGEVKHELEYLETEVEKERMNISEFAPLLTSVSIPNFATICKIDQIKTKTDNIAGVEVPLFQEVVFHPIHYTMFDTPLWFESALRQLQRWMIAKAHVLITTRKKDLLEHELRDITIRVNLFEKNLIPHTKEAIKKIAIFIGDQELAEISRAKVAKMKSLQKKQKVLTDEN